MSDYYHIFNNEAVTHSLDEWLATQDRLGCDRCGRVETPRAVHAEVEDLCDFTNLTTRTSRRRRPSNKMGGCITLIAAAMIEAIGRESIRDTFFVGRVTCEGRIAESHFTLVPRKPESALWIRSEEPLHIINCPFCSSELHAFDGPAYVVATNLTDPIYPLACNANGFVVRRDVAERLLQLSIRACEIEPIQIKQPGE